MLGLGEHDAPLPSRPIDAERARILTDLLGEFTPGKLVDLATGTGWFAQIAASLGWQVTALDARERPWEEQPGITWLRQDVRDAELTGYDLILCLGLFYHLTCDDQLDLLDRCAETPLILDTHVSLDDTVTVNGFTGLIYHEPGDILSSSGNPESFWPSLLSLNRMLAGAGYKHVEAVEPWYHGADRTFWTCRP